MLLINRKRKIGLVDRNRRGRELVIERMEAGFEDWRFPSCLDVLRRLGSGSGPAALIYPGR